MVASASRVAADPARHERNIGPNALIQTARALVALHGEAAALPLLVGAGEAEVLAHPPQEMVAEARFNRLVTTLAAALGPAEADRVLRRAGELTGDYLLQHRIPAGFQWLLRRLPTDMALRLLLGAIGSHAWTFSGSGHFHYAVLGGGRVALTIDDCPACRGVVAARPICGFYAGTFEHLFHRLVDPAITVVEAGCHACGGAGCWLEAGPAAQARGAEP